MKYGEILDYRTRDKAVVGKRYFFSDILYNLIISPQDCAVNILGRVKEHARHPFEIGSNLSFQFAREIIEEEPKFIPYKDTDEMIDDFKRRFNVEVPPYDLPMIWVRNKVTKVRSHVSVFSDCLVTICGLAWDTDKLFDRFTYLDGSPCGIKEE